MRTLMASLLGIMMVTMLGVGAGCGKSGSTKEGNKKLEVKVGQESYTVKANETTDVEVTVTRTNIEGEVEIEISNLPEGVKVEGDKKVKLTGDKNDHTFHLKGPDEIKTEITDHQTKVTAHHKDMKDDSEVTFKVSVKKE